MAEPSKKEDSAVARWIYRQQGQRQTNKKKKQRPEREIRRRQISNSTTDDIATGVTVTEPPRQLPILDTCDVLVVGGGPAGISAALAAKRCGVDVIIMERFGCFGGVITTVGMETVGWYRYEGTEDCTGSIGLEMERVARSLGASRKFAYNDSECLDAERFKSVADELLLAAGVRPLLHIMAVEVVLKPIEHGHQRVSHVVTESKSGRQAIQCKYVVDCTGDADVAFLAGVPFTQIPLKESLGITAVFNVNGLKVDKFLDHVEKNKKTYDDWGEEWAINLTEKEKELPSPYLELEESKDKTFCGSWSSLDEDVGVATNLNLVHLSGLSAVNVKDLTHAEIQGRRDVKRCITTMQNKLPGFEQAKLRNHAMTIGVRDSRKILGEYNLTKQDVMEQARFKDCIGIFPEFIDGYSILVLPTSGRFFHVPLRSLIPTSKCVVRNLLVGGRCIAGDNASHASMRNMMACTVSGAGAGVAAAIAVKTGVADIHSVDVPKVQKELQRQGVALKGLGERAPAIRVMSKL